MPAEWWDKQNRDDKISFGNHYGLYSFITKEAIELLITKFYPATTIEIDSGHGHFSAALGIRATDNF